MKITKSPNKFLIQTKPIFALNPLMCEQDFGLWNTVFVITEQSIRWRLSISECCC